MNLITGDSLNEQCVHWITVGVTKHLLLHAGYCARQARWQVGFLLFDFLSLKEDWDFFSYQTFCVPHSSVEWCPEPQVASSESQEHVFQGIASSGPRSMWLPQELLNCSPFHRLTFTLALRNVVLFCTFTLGFKCHFYWFGIFLPLKVHKCLKIQCL